MANLNNPHGLRPLGISISGSPAQMFENFAKAVGLDTAIFVYDAVARVADGSITGKAADITPGTTTYSGVAMNYGAASTATTHSVLVSPDALYEAQCDDGAGGAGNDMEALDEGLNAQLVLTAGNTVTHVSKHQVDSSTRDVTDTIDVHLLKLLAVPDNAYGVYARFEILFNKHRMNPGRVGV